METLAALDLHDATLASELLDFAQDCLLECFDFATCGAQPGSAERLRLPRCERVNVTLRTLGRLRGSMSAEGETLGEQIRRAVEQAATDKRFHSRLTAIEVPQVDIELWLQTGSEPVTAEDIEGGRCLELGVHGVAIRMAGKSAYYKPSVPITSGKRSLQSLLSGLSRKAGLPGDAWKDPSAELLRTHWTKMSRDAVRNPHQAPGERVVSREMVGRWLQESVRYLVNSRQASASFTYLYDPIEDVEVLEPANRVRAAGCLYSLSRFRDSPHAIFADPGFDEALRGLADAQLRRTVVQPDGSRVMPEADSGVAPKLGATALLTLAIGGDWLSLQSGSIYEELFASVSQAQQPSGRFLTHFGCPEEDPRSSEFFSGQSLLTLVQRAERGDAGVLDRCALAFASYRRQFQTAPASAFVGWHVDVWSRLALLTRRSDYADFAFEQTDWLLAMQVQSGSFSTWIGGFCNSGSMPKYSSIVFLEATVRAYILAHTLGDDARADRYRLAIELGVRFCDRLRLDRSQYAWFRNPARCEGGIALSTLDRRVRCDVPQHFITLCLALLEAEGIY